MTPASKRFTDDDLTRLKKAIRNRFEPLPDFSLNALLARLEAAEKLALHNRNQANTDDHYEDDKIGIKLIEAWRKSKGE